MDLSRHLSLTAVGFNLILSGGGHADEVLYGSYLNGNHRSAYVNPGYVAQSFLD